MLSMSFSFEPGHGPDAAPSFRTTMSTSDPYSVPQVSMPRELSARHRYPSPSTGCFWLKRRTSPKSAVMAAWLPKSKHLPHDLSAMAPYNSGTYLTPTTKTSPLPSDLSPSVAWLKSPLYAKTTAKHRRVQCARSTTPTEANGDAPPRHPKPFHPTPESRKRMRVAPTNTSFSGIRTTAAGSDPSQSHLHSITTCACTGVRDALAALLAKEPTHRIDPAFLALAESSNMLHSDLSPLPNHWSSAISLELSATPLMLTPTTRLGLVNTLIQLNDDQDLQYHGETLYTAITYLDRYFSASYQKHMRQLAMHQQLCYNAPLAPTAYRHNADTLSHSDALGSSYGASYHHQLIAVTCLYLAAKVCEDGCAPLTSTFARFLGAYNCTAADIRRTEHHILHTLQWNMYVVTPHAIAGEILRCCQCSCHRYSFSHPVDLYPSPETSPYNAAKVAATIASPLPHPDALDPALIDCSSSALSLFDEASEYWKLIMLNHTNMRLAPSVIALAGLYKASHSVPGLAFSLPLALQLLGVSRVDLDLCLQTLEVNYISDDGDDM
ncbi:hypothetical protein H4R35_004461 [Dimargaris xerosporica]|nr:hypothetical protein H4R35_004461 [Dimargaris xerosporica]